MDYIKEAPTVLKDYLVYMETIMGRSRPSVNEYYLDLRTFFRYILMSRGLSPSDCDFSEIPITAVDLPLVRSITRTEVLDYLLFLSRERPKHHKSDETEYGNSARTRARKISSLRGFYRFRCEKLQDVENNPTKTLDTPKQRKELPKFLTESESLKLLQAVGEGPHSDRDYCILTLFLNCGMRVSELCGINLADISTDNRLRIRGKGGKERIVYLNDACTEAIDTYLNSPQRVVPKVGNKNALFISRPGNRLGVQMVKALVKKYLMLAGLDAKDLSVHKLRHTAATLMYQNGVDVRTLKEVLGHENLDTTMIYTHVVDENLHFAAKNNPLSGVKRKPRPDDPDDE